MSARLRPSKIAIGDAVLDDLRRRLDAYRAPPAPDTPGWGMGIDLGYLDSLLRYWRTDFDWRAAERRLNQLPHHMITVDAADGSAHDIHLVIEPGSGSNPIPLLLTAGWPSSFFEFHKVIDRLAHPERHGGNADDGMTVIVADLPGFGLSAGPPRPMGHRAIAALWAQMMTDLGHARFLVHGGDWGAVVGSWLAVDFPDRVLGLHLSMLGLRPVISKEVPLSDAERQWLGATKARLDADSGYREVQATKPNTVAVGLADSPAALAAWIIEKYHGWSGGPVDGPPPFDRDELLTSATLYWATNALPTANWIYWADRNGSDIGLAPGARIEAPTCLALFDNGFFPPPPTEWAARAYNIVRRDDAPTGGHFPAWLTPDAFVASVQGFRRTLR